MARIYKGDVRIIDSVLDGVYGIVDWAELDRINDEADECLKFIGIHAGKHNCGLHMEMGTFAVFTGKDQGILCVLVD